MGVFKLRHIQQLCVLQCESRPQGFMSGLKPELAVHPGFPEKFEQNSNIFMNLTDINILFIFSMELFKVFYINR